MLNKENKKVFKNHMKKIGVSAVALLSLTGLGMFANHHANADVYRDNYIKQLPKMQHDEEVMQQEDNESLNRARQLASTNHFNNQQIKQIDEKLLNQASNRSRIFYEQNPQMIAYIKHRDAGLDKNSPVDKEIQELSDSDEKKEDEYERSHEGYAINQNFQKKHIGFLNRHNVGIFPITASGMAKEMKLFGFPDYARKEANFAREYPSYDREKIHDVTDYASASDVYDKRYAYGFSYGNNLYTYQEPGHVKQYYITNYRATSQEWHRLYKYIYGHETIAQWMHNHSDINTKGGTGVPFIHSNTMVSRFDYQLNHGNFSALKGRNWRSKVYVEDHYYGKHGDGYPVGYFHGHEVVLPFINRTRKHSRPYSKLNRKYGRHHAHRPIRRRKHWAHHNHKHGRGRRIKSIRHGIFK